MIRVTRAALANNGYDKMNVGLPLDVFSKILFIIADRHGDLSLEEAMDSGLLMQYVDAYKNNDTVDGVDVRREVEATELPEDEDDDL